jgi:LPS export ABC transporter protein LptC
MWFELNVRRMNARHIAIVIYAAVTAAACQKPPVAPVGQDLPQLAAERVMTGVEFWGNSDGVNKTRTHADTALMFNRSDSTVLQLRGVRVQMFDDAGRKSGTVTAKAGSVNNQTKAMVARGNVVLVTADGKRVMTEELHYDQAAGRVWSNVHTIVINADGTRQTMDSFTSDDKFRNFQAKGAMGATGIKF